MSNYYKIKLVKNMEEKKKSDIYNIIGKNIKKYRVKKGLKQRELAEKLYLSDSFIAKLESITHQTISIDTLEDIAKILDCDIRDFFDRDIDK